MNIHIDSNRIAAELDHLATFSDVPAPAVTRVVFTPADMQARAYIKQLASVAGLSVREDAVGNTFARWEGARPEMPAVGTGSHIDAIPNAGRYDGTVGVIGGLEAIRALKTSGLQPLRSVELLLFTSEEPTRFGIGCLGSRLLSGSLAPSVGDTLRDKDGMSLNQARSSAGFTGDLASVRMSPDYYEAFIELHIEQGPMLEQERLQAGIVTAIAAPASVRLIIEGEGGHAGAVLMPARHDAFLAGAEIALALESAVKSTGAIDTVGTCGVCDVFPGAVNSVPSRVQLDLDIRDIDGNRRDGVLSVLDGAIAQISARRGVRVQTEIINADAPATCSPNIVSTLTRAAEASGATYRTMVSRAYHDSLFMSRIAPTAMLFIPCRNGWSHRPDEYSSIGDIAAGVSILARAIAQLSA